jgi:hypothetical protein
MDPSRVSSPLEKVPPHPELRHEEPDLTIAAALDHRCIPAFAATARAPL